MKSKLGITLRKIRKGKQISFVIAGAYSTEGKVSEYRSNSFRVRKEKFHCIQMSKKLEPILSSSHVIKTLCRFKVSLQYVSAIESIFVP